MTKKNNTTLSEQFQKSYRKIVERRQKIQIPKMYVTAHFLAWYSNCQEIICHCLFEIVDVFRVQCKVLNILPIIY